MSLSSSPRIPKSPLISPFLMTSSLGCSPSSVHPGSSHHHHVSQVPATLLLSSALMSSSSVHPSPATLPNVLMTSRTSGSNSSDPVTMKRQPSLTKLNSRVQNLDQSFDCSLTSGRPIVSQLLTNQKSNSNVGHPIEAKDAGQMDSMPKSLMDTLASKRMIMMMDAKVSTGDPLVSAASSQNLTAKEVRSKDHGFCWNF